MAPRIRACIDAGSTKICTMVGEMKADDRLHILGMGVSPSRGLRQGVVTDVDQAAEAIRAAVQEAEQASGRAISSACVGANGGYTSVTDGGSGPVGDPAAVASLVQAVRSAGVEVEALMPNLSAAATAVLSEEEWSEGVALADLGGGTTSVGIFAGSSLKYGSVLAIGGEHVTRDVAIVLLMRAESAEELKIKHGRAVSSSIAADEWLEGASFGRGARQLVSRQRLAQVIEARAEEILRLIGQEVERSGYEGRLPGGLVLCGGSARLSGVDELARKLLHVPVRVGLPAGVEGLAAGLDGPAYAAAVGLLQLAQSLP